jgi:hypothetical protein
MDGIDIAGPYDKEFSYEVSKDEENLRMFFWEFESRSYLWKANEK